MACVLYWLRKEGMMDVRCYRREDGAVVYVVLEEYYTSSQILCMANDRRRERDLPLFYIQDLTQE